MYTLSFFCGINKCCCCCSIYKHYTKEHKTGVSNNLLARFNVIKKRTNTFDCLVNVMLCIRDLKPPLNEQCDPLRAKVSCN